METRERYTSLHAEKTKRMRDQFLNDTLYESATKPILPAILNNEEPVYKETKDGDDNVDTQWIPDGSGYQEEEKFLEPQPVPESNPEDQSVNVKNEEDSWHKERYGWGKNCSPSCCQGMVNRKIFLVVFCITCVLQGTFHTYFVAVITTLEKLFSVPSSTIGTFLMASEIGQLSSALLLPYFAGTGHRPRYMGIGASLFAIAVLMCASPHVLVPPNLSTNNTSIQYCLANSSNSCDLINIEDIQSQETLDLSNDRTKQTRTFFIILFSSLLVVGLGQTAVYTLGIPYIDDNVASKDSPLYFSITIGVRILGPVTGFVLGSLCTRLYINPFTDEQPDYGPTNPKWLGAWWLGMLVISVLLFIASVIMFAFPSKLHKVKASSIVATPPPRPHIRDFPTAIKRLLANDILVLRTFSNVFHLLPISGLYTFLPKYLESQFRLPAFKANMIAGIAGILVMGLGIFSSGVWIRRRAPSARSVAAWVAFSAFAYASGMFVLMSIGCDVNDFAMSADLRSPNCYESECDSCSDAMYSPVCGSDSKVYFSPCHAGCSPEGADSKNLTDCSCVDYAHDGPCPVECENFFLYVIFFMSVVLIHSTSEVGSMLLTLRCVEPRDKAMALGLIQCAIGIFGNIPCPVIYGTVIDKACIIWGKDCNGVQGNCWQYESSKFRTYFHGMTGGLMMVACLIDLVVFWKAKNISFEEEKQGDNSEKDGITSECCNIELEALT